MRRKHFADLGQKFIDTRRKLQEQTAITPLTGAARIDKETEVAKEEDKRTMPAALLPELSRQRDVSPTRRKRSSPSRFRADTSRWWMPPCTGWAKARSQGFFYGSGATNWRLSKRRGLHGEGYSQGRDRRD